MRRALAIGATLVAAVLLAGCGDSSEDQAPATATAPVLEEIATSAETEVVEGSEPAEAPGLGELGDITLGSPPPTSEGGEVEDSVGRFRPRAAEAPSPSLDPLLDRGPAETLLQGPVLSFEGIAYDGMVAGYVPPDAVGDIGPAHYIEWVNAGLRVYSREGRALTDTLPGNAVFSTLPANHLCASTNLGDPVVAYDQFAERWVLTQFAFALEDDFPVGPSYSCIAVSETSDPLSSSWCAYAFEWSDTTFYDYPKLGVFGGYYLLTGIGFTRDSGSPVEQQLVAIEREPLFSCTEQPTAYRATTKPDPIWLPADVDGQEVPGSGAPLFVGFLDDGFGWLEQPESDLLAMAEFQIDPESGAGELSIVGLDQVGAIDANLCDFARSCIPAPDGAPSLDAISDRLMNRAAFRRFEGYDALVLTHSVDIDGADTAGVRWYELRNAGDGWQVANQGTFAPDDGNSRWLGSAAMDGAGNLAIAYAVSGPNTYPSVRYAARRPDDPPNTLALGEATLIEGGGVQTCCSRWGDYGALTVDPLDDCTFWYTGQYYPSTAELAWATRIVAFRLPGCGD